MWISESIAGANLDYGESFEWMQTIHYEDANIHQLFHVFQARPSMMLVE